MSKPRIIVTGAHGRLGAALVREWRHLGEEVQGYGKHDLNLSDSTSLRTQLEGLEFDVLVNCAAQTNVDRCETHLEEAMQINGHAVGVIGEVCTARKARCIHISTDYVFDGNKNAPYSEEDEARPISNYGLSKLAGEKALLAASGDHLVIRVSWVFGPDRPSFVDQIIKHAINEEKVEAISDKIASPTFTTDAAALLHPLLNEIPASGILHLSNTGECSWQQYGQFALDCAQEFGVNLKSTQVAPLAMKDLKAFVAKRPVYTAMSSQRLANLIQRSPRSWQEAVRAYIITQAPYL